MFRRFKNWRASGVLISAFAVNVGTWGVQSAHAQFHVEQPEVHSGEFEFEYFGSAFDGLPKPPAESPRHGHEMKFSYGVTGWWSLAIAAEAEQERNEAGGDDAFKLSEIEVKTIFELLPLEGNGLGLSFYGAYGESLINGVDESEIFFGPIVKFASGPLSLTTNLFPVYAFDIQSIEKEDGEFLLEKEPDHWNLEYALQLKHQVSEMLAIGGEAFGSFFDVGGDLPGNQPEQHRLGPMLYLTFGEGGEHRPGHSDHDLHEGTPPEVELSFGALFGLTDDTSDLTLKWDAEIEF